MDEGRFHCGFEFHKMLLYTLSVRLNAWYMLQQFQKFIIIFFLINSICVSRVLQNIAMDGEDGEPRFYMTGVCVRVCVCVCV